MECVSPQFDHFIDILLFVPCLDIHLADATEDVSVALGIGVPTLLLADDAAYESRKQQTS